MCNSPKIKWSRVVIIINSGTSFADKIKSRFTMAAPLLLRGLPLLRLRFCYQRLPNPSIVLLSPRLFSASSESAHPSDADASDGDQTIAVLSAEEPPKYPRWPDPDYRKWKDQETQILEDIEPIIFLAKEIIHSNRSVRLLLYY